MKYYSYYNPVRINFGNGSLQSLGQLIGSRRALLLTSKSFTSRGIVAQLQEEHQHIKQVVDHVIPNPTMAYLTELYETIDHQQFDVIVALGGGSVIDTAKVISVFFPQSESFAQVEQLIKNGDNEVKGYETKPIIAIPTTTGSGSEVTPWGTVWDLEQKKKYSLHLSSLWCEACICDPMLTMSLPRELTIQTGLDALSHSLEAIWNKNRNPISTEHAVFAAKEIMAVLPLLIDDLSNIQLRERMMYATLKAGLAFSNTQTAIAHAISYYLTLHHQIPHGIACSFSLPQISAVAMVENNEIASLLSLIDPNFQEQIEQFIASFNLEVKLMQTDLTAISKQLAGEQRAQNSIVKYEQVLSRLG